MPRTASPEIVFTPTELISETPLWEGKASRGVLRVQIGSWMDGPVGVDVRQWTIYETNERPAKGIFLSDKVTADAVAKAIFNASQRAYSDS